MSLEMDRTYTFNVVASWHILLVIVNYCTLQILNHVFILLDGLVQASGHTEVIPNLFAVHDHRLVLYGCLNRAGVLGTSSLGPCLSFTGVLPLSVSMVSSRVTSRAAHRTVTAYGRTTTVV